MGNRGREAEGMELLCTGLTGVEGGRGEEMERERMEWELIRGQGATGWMERVDMNNKSLFLFEQNPAKSDFDAARCFLSNLWLARPVGPQL